MFDYKEFLQINPLALGPVKGKYVALRFGHYWLGTFAKRIHYGEKGLVLRISIYTSTLRLVLSMSCIKNI